MHLAWLIRMPHYRTAAESFPEFANGIPPFVRHVFPNSTLLTLLADKIIKGKRIPMYRLDFQYDESRRTLSCDFTQGHTRGTWEYRIAGDSMEGTGVVMASKSVARSVKVKRVREDQVPAAPDHDSYGP